MSMGTRRARALDEHEHPTSTTVFIEQLRVPLVLVCFLGIVATGERTTATAFAHGTIEGAKSGDWLELAEQLLVPLSPRIQESRLSTTECLA